jgi:hypothetical protein
MDTAPQAQVTVDDEWCRHHFDHLSSELADDLDVTLGRMRSLCPVAHSDQYGGTGLLPPVPSRK